MKNILLLLLTLAAGGVANATAQSKTAPPTGAVVTSAADRFVLHDGAVVLVQTGHPVPLTKNVVLSNGTKINYKSGIVEFTTGKKTTLREGDYVKMNGDIVFATPASAAAARHDTTKATAAHYNPYVQQTHTPASTTVVATPMAEELTTLLARKIQLLNAKISLMTPLPANQPALDKINRQLQQLDAQIGR